MRHFWALFVCLAVFSCLAEGRSLTKREVDDSIDPLFQEVDSEDATRDKRKVDPITGVKNAVLGFVFNKINAFIDQKTHWISELDKTNIAKNKAHGIEPPKDPILSLSGAISGVIGQKLQAAGPFISIVTNKLTSGSGHGSGSGGNSAGFNFGALLNSSGGGSGNHDATAQAGFSYGATH